MVSPLVSILVPVYNDELYIERCSRSLFEQTYDNLEFIFCDDFTPDASIAILERVLAEYPDRTGQVRIIHNKHNLGISAVRNILIDNCRGEFVFYVDSDDWAEKNSVELMVAKQQETGADIVSGKKMAHFPDGDKPYLTCGWDMDREIMLEMVLRKKCTTTVTGRLIRTSLFLSKSIRYIEDVLGEDWQVFPRLIYYSKSVAGIDMFVYHYYMKNTNSISYHYLEKRKLQRDIIFSSRFLIDFFKKKKEPHYVEVCEEELVKHIHYLMMSHYKNRHRVDYEYMVSELKKANSNYWHLIGWDNSFVRCMESNWISMNILSFYRNMPRKVLRKIDRILKNTGKNI